LHELIGAGFQTDLATVLADVRLRDARDAERATAPMLAAPDAVTLDTSAMGVEEAVAAAIAVVQARRRS
jgi:cytidylate kinase